MEFNNLISNLRSENNAWRNAKVEFETIRGLSFSSMPRKMKEVDHYRKVISRSCLMFEDQLGSGLSALADDRFLIDYELRGNLDREAMYGAESVSLSFGVDWKISPVVVDEGPAILEDVLLNKDIETILAEGKATNLTKLAEATGLPFDEIRNNSVEKLGMLVNVFRVSALTGQSKLTRLVKGCLLYLDLLEHGGRKSVAVVRPEVVKYDVGYLCDTVNLTNTAYVYTKDSSLVAYSTFLYFMCQEYPHPVLGGKEHMRIAADAENLKLVCRDRSTIEYTDVGLTHAAAWGALLSYSMEFSLTAELEQAMLIACSLRENRYYVNVSLPLVISDVDKVGPVVVMKPEFAGVESRPVVNVTTARALGRLHQMCSLVVVKDVDISSLVNSGGSSMVSATVRSMLKRDSLVLIEYVEDMLGTDLLKITPQLDWLSNMTDDEILRWRSFSAFECLWMVRHPTSVLQNGMVQCLKKGVHNPIELHQPGLCVDTFSVLVEEIKKGGRKEEVSVPYGGYNIRLSTLRGMARKKVKLQFANKGKISGPGDESPYMKCPPAGGPARGPSGGWELNSDAESTSKKDSGKGKKKGSPGKKNDSGGNKPDPPPKPSGGSGGGGTGGGGSDSGPKGGGSGGLGLSGGLDTAAPKPKGSDNRPPPIDEGPNEGKDSDDVPKVDSDMDISSGNSKDEDADDENSESSEGSSEVEEDSTGPAVFEAPDEPKKKDDEGVVPKPPNVDEILDPEEKGDEGEKTEDPEAELPKPKSLSQSPPPLLPGELNLEGKDSMSAPPVYVPPKRSTYSDIFGRSIEDRLKMMPGAPTDLKVTPTTPYVPPSKKGDRPAFSLPPPSREMGHLEKVKRGLAPTAYEVIMRPKKHKVPPKNYSEAKTLGECEAIGRIVKDFTDRRYVLDEVASQWREFVCAIKIELHPLTLLSQLLDIQDVLELMIENVRYSYDLLDFPVSDYPEKYHKYVSEVRCAVVQRALEEGVVMKPSEYLPDGVDKEKFDEACQYYGADGGSQKDVPAGENWKYYGTTWWQTDVEWAFKLSPDTVRNLNLGDYEYLAYYLDNGGVLDDFGGVWKMLGQSREMRRFEWWKVAKSLKQIKTCASKIKGYDVSWDKFVATKAELYRSPGSYEFDPNSSAIYRIKEWNDALEVVMAIGEKSSMLLGQVRTTAVQIVPTLEYYEIALRLWRQEGNEKYFGEIRTILDNMWEAERKVRE